MSLTPSEPSSGEGQAGVAVEAIDHQLLAPSITEATTITGNLTSFLIEDIEEKGCHLLLPYLTTNDLLRLSECCQATTNYRYYLKSVKLVPHKSPLLSMFKRGLNQLFFHQRYTTLDYLAVDSLLSLPYFRALVLLGCIQGIKVLDVSGGSIHFGDKEMADLASTLMDGAGQQLQELRIRLIRNEANDAAVQRFILGLSLGMCPRLQRLYLQHPYHNDPPEGFLEGLGLILMAGCLPHLQVLDLTYNWSKTEGNLEGVLAAMRDGRCPALVDLRLMNCSLSLPEVVLVGQIVAEQSCPDLEHLSLSGENAGNGLEGLMDALASGFGARLKTLALDSCPVKGREGELLVRALTTGQCRNLEILGLDNCVSEPEVCLGVLEAMKLDHLPHLRLLDFSCAPFPVQHVPLLIEVLKERRCPGLEAVDVIVKEPWGDAMAAAVIEAIIEGGYQMKELQLGDVAMANGSAQVLCLALALPAWKNITRLELRLNHDLGDANMAMILRRLLPRRFLTSLVANDTRMGEEAGQVLLQGLQSGAWPRLKILNIMDTSWGPEVTEGIVDLIESRQLESLEVLCMSDMAVTEECCWKLATAFESGACSRLTGFCMNGLDVGVDWEEVFASRPEPVEVQ